MLGENETRRVLSSPTKYAFHYHERIEALYFNGSTQAFTVMLLAQFIFFNLHYVVGSSLTMLALLSLISQIFISAAEWRYLQRGAQRRLNYTLGAHFWLNRGFTALYMPFIVWTIVLMFERQHASP